MFDPHVEARYINEQKSLRQDCANTQYQVINTETIRQNN